MTTASTRVEKFRVDVRLLRELGDRLVGRPHIALAELIKNSYDADARTVEISFSGDEIIVADDGHGLSETDLLERWLRIGTGRKERQKVSPELGRSLTGSKGVGRLAVQLLARDFRLESTALRNQELSGIKARRKARRNQLHPPVALEVDWDEAQKPLPVKEGEEEALERELDTVEVRIESPAPASNYAAESRCGTRVTLRRLTNAWDVDQFRQLAREIWTLQPPFSMSGRNDFTVVLRSPHGDVVEEFDRQMRSILDIWSAKVTGQLDAASETYDFDIVRDTRQARERLKKADESTDDLVNPLTSEITASPFEAAVPGGVERTLRIDVELRDGTSKRLAVRVPNCLLEQVDYELRVFDLKNRQPQGIVVGLARDYLRRYGGVHIHDASFRLPYYGADQDWLLIDRDQARRLSASRLLPTEMQVGEGLHNLPANSRVFGTVDISSTEEVRAGQARQADPADLITIQVTRDRLADNRSFEQLRVLVRTGLELYATELARSRIKTTAERREKRPTGSSSLASARRRLKRARPQIPPEIYKDIDERLRDAEADVKDIETGARSHLSLLGALATAGMTSLAHEHESQKQFAILDGVIADLVRHVEKVPDDDHLAGVAADLKQFRDRSLRIRNIFTPLLDEETRTSVENWRARRMIEETAKTVSVLGRGTTVDASRVPDDLRLPAGSYPAWSAVVQNILVNAFNATLDQDEKHVEVDARSSGKSHRLRFQDTGVGVDLDKADGYFEPFQRGLSISSERAALGLGGSGLGLTIVKMITGELGATVQFTKPEGRFSTCLQISWKDP